MKDIKYRVYNYVNLGSGEVHHVPVSNPAEGVAVIDALADYQLTLGDNIVFSNAFGLEEWDEEEQEWVDWMDDEGFQYNDYRDGGFVTMEDLKKKYYK